MKDYYRALGVPESATQAQIRAAYRKLAKENHPDLHPGDREAEARFKEISEAYAVLSDEAARGKYDAQRQATSGSTGQASSQGGANPSQATARGATGASAPSEPIVPRSVEEIRSAFGRFFEFDPVTGEAKSEGSFAGKAPVDTGGLFEDFFAPRKKKK